MGVFIDTMNSTDSLEDNRVNIVINTTGDAAMEAAIIGNL